MKKILSFVMVFALIMSMSVTAFAAGDDSPHTVTNQDGEGVTVQGWVNDDALNADGDNDAEIAVIGKLDSDGDGIPDDEDTNPDAAGDVIAVDLSWEAMEWTYSKGNYDATNMVSTSGWLDAEKNITIKNRSNVMILADPSYTDADNDGNTGLLFTGAAKEPDMGGWDDLYTNVLALNKAAEGSVADDGTITKGTASEGTITVSLDMDAMTLVLDDSNVDATEKSATIGTITITISKEELPSP